VMNIDEIPLDDQIRIYPNPVSEQLLIECPVPSGEIKIAFYDLRGKMVAEKRYPASSGLIEYTVSGLAEGIYTVKVGTGEREAVRRVVVLKD